MSEKCDAGSTDEVLESTADSNSAPPQTPGPDLAAPRLVEPTSSASMAHAPADSMSAVTDPIPSPVAGVDASMANAALTFEAISPSGNASMANTASTPEATSAP